MSGTVVIIIINFFLLERNLMVMRYCLCMFMLPYQIRSPGSIGSLQLWLYTTAQEVMLNLQLSISISYEGNILEIYYIIGNSKWATH